VDHQHDDKKASRRLKDAARHAVNRDKHKAQAKAWRAANHEKTRAYALANRERINALRRARDAARRDSPAEDEA
jgi:hypothetical protein